MCQYCMIVPRDVLLRLSKDKAISKAARDDLKKTALLDAQVRLLRAQAQQFTLSAMSLLGQPNRIAAAPAITVFDCQNTTALPGKPLKSPQTSKDTSAQTVFDTTSEVARFFKQVFGRNSLDDAGLTLQSSIHYGSNYNNAFWNGMQMAYGDGDGQVFVELCKGPDVIAHELMHGVTQYTLQLVYKDEPGGLNESLSDVFGSMFKQWLRQQTVATADWLIGDDILGAQAVALGYTCLRNMAAPAAAGCLGPQITHFNQYHVGMDPHESSGVANLAFHTIATTLGGNSWDEAGLIWYDVVSKTGSSPNMTMKQFADQTRTAAGTLFAAKPSVAQAVNAGWNSVGL